MQKQLEHKNAGTFISICSLNKILFVVVFVVAAAVFFCLRQAMGMIFYRALWREIKVSITKVINQNMNLLTTTEYLRMNPLGEIRFTFWLWNSSHRVHLKSHPFQSTNYEHTQKIIPTNNERKWLASHFKVPSTY